MLKSLIISERITTTVPKAKALRRFADRMITLAKENTLASRRRAIAQLMIRFNTLSPKEARDAKNGSKIGFNDDRLVIEKLFSELGTRFSTRQGGYTRILKTDRRQGDNAQTCIIEYIGE